MTTTKIHKTKLLFGIGMAALLLVALWGCGYSINKSENLSIHCVKIGKLINTTGEPKLEDKLYVALTEQFMQEGVEVSNTCGNRLDGKITQFKLIVLSEKQKYAAEYGIEINADFTFVTKEGKTRKISGASSPFIESFSSPSIDTINEIVASKEAQEQRTLKTLAMSVVSDLIYYRY